MSQKSHIYFNRLLKFCEDRKIDLFSKRDGDTYVYYGDGKKEIHINSRHTTLLQISSILHELGHIADDTRSRGKYDEAYAQGLKKIRSGTKLNQKQFDAIMRCETRAWMEGELIARVLNIPLGKWFHKDKERCLLIYYKAPTFKKVIK